MLWGGQGRSAGLNCCRLGKYPAGPAIVDSSSAEKARMVVGMDVVPQSSPACKPWKFRYMDGEVLSRYQDNVQIQRWRYGKRPTK